MLNGKLLVVVAIAIAGAVALGGSAFAKSNGGTRPGWGNGDQNHVHTGPPGQSVRPGHDDENEANEDKNDDKGHKEDHSTNSSTEHGKSGHDD